MFEQIAKFSSRFRYPIIVTWLVLVIVVLIFAPSLADVVTSDQSSYLPKDEASVVAAEIAAEYFPDQASPAQAVLVIQSENGPMHDAVNQAYLAELSGWLENELPPEAIGTVLSPTDPDLAKRLISEDGRVAMIVVGLHGSIEDPAVLGALDEMRARLEDAPQGLSGYVTGSVAVLDDYITGALESADRTTVITIVLVIVILLFIYRTPVAPIVPLVTIGMAFLVSRGLVAWLTGFGMVVSSITEVFLVVLLFGAGTDYCLFLVSRFREYMADGLPGPEGARLTVGRVGETITSSAGTVIVGMVALSFAEMKLFASTGPSMALGVAVALLAGLTLTPALLAVMGKWAFWPGGARHAKHGGFWGKLARWVTTRPWVPLLLALVVLVPLAVYGQGMARNFDLLSDLPDDVPSKAGFDLLSRSFGAGEMQPLDVIVTGIPDAHSPAGMAHINALTQDLLADEGVADVRSLTLPAGQAEPEVTDALRVDGQLALMSETIDEIRTQTADPAALADLDVEEAMAGFDLVRDYLDDLAAAFPDLVGDTNYQDAQASLQSLEQAIEEGQQRLLVSNQLAEAAAGISSGLAGALDGGEGMGAEAVDALAEMTAQFSVLRDYLAGMAEAHPALAGLGGYQDALGAIAGLEATAAEIKETLLVSTQLDLLAQGIAGMAAMLEDPQALAELSASPEQMEAIDILDTYLEELVAAHPWLAEQPAYRSAMEHLAAMQTEVEALVQAQLVSSQLTLIAQEMDATVQALEENPLALLPQPDEPSAAEQMVVLTAYLEELGAAYPSLATTEEYGAAMTVMAEMGEGLEQIDFTQLNQLIEQTKESLATLSAAFAGLSAVAAETLPDAVFVPEELPEGMLSFAPDLAPIVDEITAAGQDLAALSETVRLERPEATFVPETSLSAVEGLALTLPGTGLDPLPALEADLDALVTALERLSAEAADQLPDAAYVPPEEILTGTAAAFVGDSGSPDAVVESLMADVDAFQAALDALAEDFAGRPDGFFIPAGLAEETGQDIDQLLDTYSTADGDAARLQVVLAYDPFSQKAMDTVARLQDRMRTASTGYVSGSTATNLDLQRVMDRDFVRVMGLVIGGIFVVLLLLLRSLVAPIYMMATILLSYGATMGITRLIFDNIYGEGITWFVPFLIFVVLVALGMDYNIFLMGRVKEEVARHSSGGGNGTRPGIERAVERTGGIITSAGIIMAGTFGAMMSSSLLGLVQLAFAVAVGMLLDTFVIRTTLVPAIATLLDRWNWWPGKGPGK
jgi:uncharacterized membrane protein YdfJ with MMPL/SSD domain